MCFINQEYFFSDIYITESISTITDEVTDIGKDILDYINDQTEQFLIKFLGLEFYLELVDNIDLNKDNLIKDNSDEKWDNLINGNTYNNSNNELCRFKGLRYKSKGNTRYRSLIAYYIYYKYQSDFFISQNAVGQNIPKPKNSEFVSPDYKAIKSFRKFHELTYGKKYEPIVNKKNNLYSVNYSNNNENNDKSLYSFLEDNKEIYPNFKPFYEKNINYYLS